MTFPRHDRGPQRVLERKTEIEYDRTGPKATRTSTRVYTGPRKALRCL